MPHAMTPDRFAELADAFGGEVARWPLAEQEAAASFVADHPQAAETLLRAAADLDWTLGQWRAPAAAPGLYAAVLEAAPRARPARVWTTWLWRTGLGAGLVAAGAAGLMAGVVVSSSVAPASDLDVIAAAAPTYEDLAAAVGGEV